MAKQQSRMNTDANGTNKIAFDTASPNNVVYQHQVRTNGTTNGYNETANARSPANTRREKGFIEMNSGYADRRKDMNYEQLLHRFQLLESENLRLVQEQTGKMREVNRQLESNIVEIRNLKELNQRLIDENQELRDLCCFLDDDRQKAKKIARDWQKFGKYTSSIMQQEVVNYHNKLCDLENKQKSLLQDNVELRELCLYLDEERQRTFQMSQDLTPTPSYFVDLEDDIQQNENNQSPSKKIGSHEKALKLLEEEIRKLRYENTLLRNKYEASSPIEGEKNVNEEPSETIKKKLQELPEFSNLNLNASSTQSDGLNNCVRNPAPNANEFNNMSGVQRPESLATGSEANEDSLEYRYVQPDDISDEEESREDQV